jgi:acyl carrier protein
VFIEIGPDGTLSALGRAALGDARQFIPLLRPGRPAAAAVTRALAQAHVHGVAVDWAAVLGGGQRVELPTYAFQHQWYWPKARRSPVPAGGDGAVTPAEAWFWAAVEGEDAQALGSLAAIDGEQPFSQALPALAAWRRRERDRSVTARWQYRISWTPVPDPGPVILAGTWLIVVPDEAAAADLAGDCARALTAAGAQVSTARTTSAERAELAGLIGAARSGADAGRVAGVLSLLALDEAPVAGHPVVPAGLAATLGLVQALGDAGVVAPLWVVTRGAVAAGPGERLASAVQAAAWGLGRVAGLEYPDRWGGLVDLPSALDERAGERLCAVLAGCGEDQLAIRPAGISARRLARAPHAPDRRPWQPRGTMLITGGTGAIGGHVARWGAAQGVPRIVLASRSGPGAAGAAARAAALAGAGAAAAVIACDTADRGQVAGLLTRIGAGGPPLSAVMHAAGVIDDGLLDGLDTSRLASVLAAKAASAVYLDELTRETELDQFVLFSSAAATLGGAGQGNYAAANAFLDGLAQQRAGRGLAGLSLAWGPWAGSGVAKSSEAVRERVHRGPLPEMDPALAVKALGHALGGPDSLLALMDVDWAQFAAAPIPFVRDLPDITELARDPASRSAGPLTEAELTKQLAGLPRARQIQVLTDLIRTAAAMVLGHASADGIEADRAFTDLGFDSLTSLEMRHQLNALTGLRLPATLLFDYPTPAVLAEYLRAEAFDRDEAGPPVLAELDKLAGLLSSITQDDERRSEIAARLAVITQEFRAEPADDSAAGREIETATNDEMFDLVQRELRDTNLEW